MAGKTMFVFLLSVCTVVTMHRSRDKTYKPYGVKMCMKLCESLGTCYSARFMIDSLSCHLGSVNESSEESGKVVRIDKYNTTEKYDRIILSRSKGNVIQKKQKFGIPKDYKLFSDLFARMYIKRHPENKTWKEALTVCESEGATLLKLDTKTRIDLFTRSQQNLIPKKQSIHWIGLSRPSPNDTWQWTDGTSSSATSPFGYWSDGPIHISKYMCAVVSIEWLGLHGIGKWIGEPCANTYTFICEIVASGSRS